MTDTQLRSCFTVSGRDVERVKVPGTIILVGVSSSICRFQISRSEIDPLEEWLEGLYLLWRMIWLCELFISKKLWSTENRNNSFPLSLLILEAAVMQFLTFSA